MKLKEAIQDTNKALKQLNELDYIESVKYSFKFIKQGFRDVFHGVKQIFSTVVCLLVYPLLPILYPFAIFIRVFKK